MSHILNAPSALNLVDSLLLFLRFGHYDAVHYYLISFLR